MRSGYGQGRIRGQIRVQPALRYRSIYLQRKLRSMLQDERAAGHQLIVEAPSSVACANQFPSYCLQLSKKDANTLTQPIVRGPVNAELALSQSLASVK